MSSTAPWPARAEYRILARAAHPSQGRRAVLMPVGAAAWRAAPAAAEDTREEAPLLRDPRLIPVPVLAALGVLNQRADARSDEGLARA